MVELGALIAIASTITFIVVSTSRHMEERKIEDEVNEFTFESWLDYEHEQARKAQEEK